MLLQGGAPLSRHLAQLLLVLFPPHYATNQFVTLWGAGISLKSYCAVMEMSEQLVRILLLGSYARCTEALNNACSMVL